MSFGVIAKNYSKKSTFFDRNQENLLKIGVYEKKMKKVSGNHRKSRIEIEEKLYILQIIYDTLRVLSKKKVDTMLLIKNADVYTPEYIGQKDVLIAGEQIEYIASGIEIPTSTTVEDRDFPCEIIDATGLKLIPGLIDQHVHVTGGGGEGGFKTRAPEVKLSELIKGGITTVVGLLGTDGVTRSLENLYAKTMALNEEGITAYMLTGAYDYPSPTLTGAVDKDIVLIEKVLGVKLAISDHRAPNVTLDQLIQLASKTRVAGMLSGKPGMVTLHMGDAQSGLKPVFEAIDQTAIPTTIFRPTHVNRNPRLLEEAYAYAKKGGYIDFTCGITGHNRPAECIAEAKKRGVPTDRITISSDGQGSWSRYDHHGRLIEIGVSSVESIYKELKSMVQEHKIKIEEALPFVTSNVAEALGLKDTKGCIKKGADADVLLLNPRLEIDTVIAKGKIMMQGGDVLVKGTYE